MIRADGRALVAVAAVVIVATVAAALMVGGSPAQQRDARMDARRVQDLQRIEAAVQAYARQHDALPDALDGLDQATDHSLSLVEPDTGTGYGYGIEGAERYRLCAVFITDSRGGRHGRGDQVAEGWQHPAGPHCFQRRLAARSPAADAR
ncbi:MULTISPECIES: hypothetical protein [unclassified Luteimonas]